MSMFIHRYVYFYVCLPLCVCVCVIDISAIQNKEKRKACSFILSSFVDYIMRWGAGNWPQMQIPLLFEISDSKENIKYGIRTDKSTSLVRYFCNKNHYGIKNIF